MTINLSKLATPWAKPKEIYGVSILFSVPTAAMVGALFRAASDPVTAVLPDVFRITFIMALAGLTLAATGVAHTPLRAFAATGYLHALAALVIGIISLHLSFSQLDLYYFLIGLILIGSMLTALLVSSIALRRSFRK